MRTTHGLMALVLLSALPAWSAEAWREGFERGDGGTKPYHKDAPRATVEVVTGGAAEGERFLRSTLPGERRLEGVVLNAGGLTGARVARVGARVRGSGEIWLCLYSRNGWLYAPATVKLTATWQEIALRKVLVAADTSLGINFLGREVQRGAVFEIDDLSVTLEDPPAVADSEVGPWRLEGEAFAERAVWAGKTAAAGSGYVSVAGLPFPRTSRPVTVAVRVDPSADGDTFRLNATAGDGRQKLAEVTARGGEPQWLSFPPLVAGEVGESFTLDGQGKADTPVAIDAVVVATAPVPDPDAAPALLPSSGLVTAATIAAPTIDGDPGDAAWRGTVACGGFLTNRSLIPAEADTTVRLGHDATHLYLLYDCAEPRLDPAAQRTHEFKAAVKEPDGEVWGDDCVVLLLAPPGDTVYDWFVNSRGVIADARCRGDNLWGTREAGWQSGARAAAKVADGRWTVELAIPLAALGGRTGGAWRLCLGRIAACRGESSTWSPCTTGFHDPACFAALRFGGPSPGVALAAPASFEPGDNTLTVDLTPGPEPNRLTLLWQAASDPARRTGLVALDPATAHRAIPFAVGDGEAVTARQAVLAADSLAPLVVSPEVTRRISQARATLNLFAAGPWEVFLDGRRAGGGQGDGVVQLSLKRGANLIAVKATGGVAATLAAGQDAPAPVRWKLVPATEAKALDSAWDDASAPTAPELGRHPKLGPIVGQAGEAVVLRHLLLWEKTRVWPKPAPAVYLARGSAQHLTLTEEGLPKRKLHDWTVTVAVPPPLTVLGSTGYYGTTRETQPEWHCQPAGEQVIDGRAVPLVKITATRPVVPVGHPILNLFNLYLTCPADAPEPAGDLLLTWWSSGNDGTVTEPGQRCPIRLLPPLRGQQPKTLLCQLWGSFFSSMDDLALREQTLATARSAGFTDMVSGDAATTDLAHKHGQTHTLGVRFVSWSIDVRPYLEAHPDQRLSGKDGQPAPDLICTTMLLGEAWPAVEESLGQQLAKTRPDTVDYDYEYPPLSGPHSCYCPRCLAAFAKAAGLNAAELTPETIANRHAEAWVDFMARRVAAILRRMKDSVHKLRPGTEFSTYSGYQTPDNAARYGIDWRYIGDEQACDRAGCGYGRPAEAVAATVAALKGIPLVCGALLTPYDVKLDEPLALLTKARLLRRFLDSTGGVLVYDRLPMDGRVWWDVAETTRLVAEYEEAFVKGTRGPLGALDTGAVTVLRHGPVTLVCVMNHRSSEARFPLTLPAEAGPGVEFYSGAKVPAGGQVECLLPAGESAAYVLRRG